MLVVPNGGDAWTQQFRQGFDLAVASGNDHPSLGLWWFRIPTFLQYNQFSSRGLHLLTKLTLQSFNVPQVRNITIYTRPNARILQLLGVRYLITPGSIAGPIGALRATEDIAGQTWQLSELPNANLATYAPTVIQQQQDLPSALEQVASDDFDPTREVTVANVIVGPLVPASSAALSFFGDDLRIRAASYGRTLVVLPLEYSHCLEVHDARTGVPAKNVDIFRVDGILTGVLLSE